MTAVLDASALLCVFLNEKGCDTVVPFMRGAAISALNASESFSRAVDNGFPATEVVLLLAQFEMTVAAFDLQQAQVAADLRPKTRHVGASLGDRACLALAMTRAQPMLTGDRRLADLDLGIDIRLIR